MFPRALFGRGDLFFDNRAYLFFDDGAQIFFGQFAKRRGELGRGVRNRSYYGFHG